MNVRREFGLSELELQEILKSQDYRCKICNELLGESYHVDHCHLYNEVRSILCFHCNIGLGHFRDNIKNLRRAAQYIEEWSDKHCDHLSNVE